jgi:hypothetical protein
VCVYVCMCVCVCVCVCVGLHRFAEGIWLSKLDQINTASKETGVDGERERERENIDQLIYMDPIFKKKLA